MPKYIFISMLLLSTTAQADGAATLAMKNGCMACHAIDTKVIGPAYKDVAARYANDPKARAKLSAKIKSGGSGNWGTVAMPPHPQLTDEEATTLANWVLSQKS